MTRLLWLVVVLPAVGCMGVQPVGPMAKLMPAKSAPADALDAKEKDAAPPPADEKAAAAPATAGGRPVPPAILITPGEVAVEHPEAAVTKLGNELEYDLKNTPPAPKTPIISRYKNGEKVQ